MLAYAHINLLLMLSRFKPDEAVRVATDSIYVRKSALKRFEGVDAFIPMKKMRVRSRFPREEYLPAVAPAQWRDKDEELYMPVEHSAYLAKPDYIVNIKKDLSPSTAPRHDDPLSRHRLSYLSGGGGSGKPRERSSSTSREIPLSSSRPIAWPKRCRPGASRLRPTTASSVGVARRSGRLKGWGRSSFPV